LVIQSLPEIFYAYHEARAGVRGDGLDQIVRTAPPETRAAAWRGLAHCQILPVRVPDMQLPDAVKGHAFAP